MIGEFEFIEYRNNQRSEAIVNDHPCACFYLHRLLDICIGGRTTRETRLTLVFEYVEQDLDNYLKNAPSAGLEPEGIQVEFYYWLI